MQREERRSLFTVHSLTINMFVEGLAPILSWARRQRAGGNKFLVLHPPGELQETAASMGVDLSVWAGRPSENTASHNILVQRPPPWTGCGPGQRADSGHGSLRLVVSASLL